MSDEDDDGDNGGDPDDEVDGDDGSTSDDSAEDDDSDGGSSADEDHDHDDDGGASSDEGDDDDAGTSVDEGGDGGTSVDEGGDAGTSADAGGDGGTSVDEGGDAGWTCASATEGIPGDCTDLASWDSELGTFAESECADAETTMSSGTLELFRACLLGLTAEELDDATNVYKCKDDATKAVCVDETTETECATIAGWCPDQDAAECMQTLSGLNAQGRADITGCMEGFCNLYSCLEGL